MLLAKQDKHVQRTGFLKVLKNFPNWEKHVETETTDLDLGFLLQREMKDVKDQLTGIMKGEKN